MLIQALLGVVEHVSGVLAQTKPNGDVHIAKQGTPIEKGDYLTLLSGEAYIHMIEGFPQALALNKPFLADGTSPLLSSAPSETLTESLVQEALLVGLDPSVILSMLEATAAGPGLLGSGGKAYVINPLYGLGSVTVGYPTKPVHGLSENPLLHVDFFTKKVQVADDQFNIAAVLHVEEDALPNVGNRELQQTQSTISSFNLGAISSTGQPVTFAFNTFSGTLPLKSGGVDVDFTATPNLLTGTANGNTVLTIAIDANGQLTFTIIGQIDHPNADGNDSETLSLDISQLITVSFPTGNPVVLPPLSVIISIEDDVPKFLPNQIEGENPTITVDETVLDVNGTANFASSFNPAYGADGPGTLVYALNISPGESGLIDSQTLEKIVLSKENNNVVGKTESGQLVFTVSVASDGTVTLNQDRAVIHTPNINENDVTTLNSANLITLTAILTDSDGDTVSQSINIGTSLFFRDDAPTLTDKAIAKADTLQDDDSTLNLDATANFADNFNGVFNPGNDLPATMKYELTLSANGTESGLFALDGMDVSTSDSDGYGKGSPILLSKNLDGSISGKDGTTEYFVITIDASGTVTFNQKLAIWHDNTGSIDENTTLTSEANTLGVKATITDADGDAQSATLDLSTGVFSIKDDGPSVSANTTVKLDDDDLPAGIHDTTSPGDDATVNLPGGVLAHNYGTDGAGSINWLNTGAPAGFTYNLAANNSLEVTQLQNNVNVKVLTLTLNTGTGAYTVTQNANILHPTANQENNVELTFNYKVTDGDGDSVNGTFKVNVDDDIPINTDVCLTASVDEDTIPGAGGNPGGPGDINASYITTISAANVASLFKSGADANLTYTLNNDSALITDLLSQGLKSGGVALQYLVSGNTLTASAGSTQVFTLVMNADHSVTFTLKQPLDHNPLLNTTEDDIILQLGNFIKATDTDGDVVVAPKNALTITADDDTPVAVICLNDNTKIRLDESTGTPPASMPDANATADDMSANNTDKFLGSYGTPIGQLANQDILSNTGTSVGADKIGATVKYSLEIANPNSGLSATNISGLPLAITLYKEMNGDITGRTGSSSGPVIFAIKIDEATGDVTVAQYKAIHHPTSPNSYDESVNLGSTINAVITVTDGDKDVASDKAAIGSAIVFEDDGPTISISAKAGAALVLDESVGGPLNESDETLSSDLTDIGYAKLVATDLFAVNPDAGQDGQKSLTYKLSLSANNVDSGLFDTATNTKILLSVNPAGTEVEGKAGSILVFKITINANGNTEVFQYKAIKHDDPNNPDESGAAPLGTVVQRIKDGVLNLTATITDGDNDTATSKFDLGKLISFEDDGPSVSTNVIAKLDDDDLNPLGNHNTDSSGDDLTVNLPGVLGHSFGTDGAGSINWLNTGAPAGFTYNLVGTNLEVTQLQNNINVKVLTLTLDTTTGAYTVTQNANILHPTANQENNVELTFNYKVTDRDGDSVNGTFKVNVDDDIPLAHDISKSVTAANGIDTNVMLILDVSGSMGTNGGAGITNLKIAAQKLLDQYDILGEIRVRIVTFSATAHIEGDEWMEIGAAKSYIQGLTTGGNTNFDGALINAMDAFMDTGKIAGAQNVSYFISDGNPTANEDWQAVPGSLSQNGIQSGEEAAWKTFLTTDGEKINSFALGIGVGINLPKLDPIAYDGVTPAEKDGILVPNPNDLASVLVGTVVTPTIVGSLITDPNPDASFGADGGHINFVTINGVKYQYNTSGSTSIDVTSAGPTTNTYDFNTTTHELTVTLATGEKFQIDMDNGSYIYTPPANITNSIDRPIAFQLIDNDGDPADATLNLHVDVPLKAQASNATVDEAALDTVKDPSDLLAGTVTGSLPDLTTETVANVPLNVTGGNGPLSYTLLSNPQGNYGTISLNPNGSYTYTLTKPVDTVPDSNGTNTVMNAETFTYQVSDGTNTSTNTITINIIDDKPIANADTNSVSEGNTLNVSIANGVLNNDVAGADGYAAGGGVIGFRKANNDTTTAVDTGVNTDILGQYGTLHLNADGSYTYKANPNVTSGPAVIDNFVYSIKDGDGDISTTTLKITINNVTVFAASDDGMVVNESAMDTIKDPGDVVAGLITGSLASSTLETALDSLAGNAIGGTGPYTYSIAGTDGNGNKAGTYGTIHIDTNGNYKYTLTKPVDTTPDSNGANTADNAEVFTYTVTDSKGNTATAQIKIDIVDDAPIANPDTNSLTEGATINIVAANGVLFNDKAGADGYAPTGSVVGVSIGSNTVNPADSTKVGVEIPGTYGKLTLNADGSYTYKANPNVTSGPAVVDNFVYSIKDGDGDISTTTLKITITNSGIIAVDDCDATVYEKALDLNKDGIDLAAGTVTGSLPNSTLETTTNSLPAPTGAVGALAYTLVSQPTGLYGQIKLETNGNYKYTLTKNYLNPTANDGITTQANKDVFTYEVKDANGNTSQAKIYINIVDDVPCAVNISRTGMASEGGDTNVMMILDVSGSMGENGGAGIHTLINSSLELLEQYEALGAVKVRLVTFSNSAQAIGSGWMTVDQAQAAILSLDTDGYTNYDAALLTAMSAFNSGIVGQSDGRIEGAQNVAYFLSDGNPTVSQSWPQVSNDPNSLGILGGEQTYWENFLKDSNGPAAGGEKILSYALGMGVDVNISNLEPIAYNGVAGGENAAIGVDDINDLPDVLVKTITSAPLSGTLLDGVGASFGADGGYIKSITVNGVTYNYNGTTSGSATVGSNSIQYDTNTHVLTVTIGNAAGEKFQVDMDTGAYIFTPPMTITASINRDIQFVLIDNDGDTSTAKINFNIPVAGNDMPLVVRDDLVLTNQAEQSNQDKINIPTWALLANDTGGQGVGTITSVTNTAPNNEGTVTLLTPQILEFKEASSGDKDGTYDGSNANPFGYTNTTGSESDTAKVDLDRSQINDTNLDGDFRNEILLGRDGSADTIKGNDGNDILIGLGGNDALKGGDGDDILAGGAGSDNLDGGNGNDTATYIDSANGVVVSLQTGVATGGDAQGDTLTSIENLTGSKAIDTLTGNQQANILKGLDGNDILSGLDGNDTLVGGKGSDKMTGGNGADTFAFQADDETGVSIKDTITDFNIGQGDKLDLTDLLKGEHATKESLDAYLDFSTSGSDTTVTVHTDGGATAAQQLILLQGVTLTGSDQTIIQNLLTAQAILTSG